MPHAFRWQPVAGRWSHFGTALAVRWIGLPLEAGQHFALHAASLGVLGHATHHPQTRVIALWNATPDQRGLG